MRINHTPLRTASIAMTLGLVVLIQPGDQVLARDQAPRLTTAQWTAVVEILRDLLDAHRKLLAFDSLLDNRGRSSGTRQSTDQDSTCKPPLQEPSWLGSGLIQPAQSRRSCVGGRATSNRVKGLNFNQQHPLNAGQATFSPTIEVGFTRSRIAQRARLPWPTNDPERPANLAKPHAEQR